MLLCCLAGSLLTSLLYCFLTVTLKANQNVTGLAITTFGVGVGNLFGGSLIKIFKSDVDPAKYVEEKGLKTVNDEGALRKTVEEVIANNPQSVQDYKSGKEKAIGFLVGQTMKAMKGKADPGMINKMLKELL